VAGVEADAQRRVPVDGVEVRAQVLQPGRQRATAARARLDEQPRSAARQGLVEQREQRLAYLP
jgi:hypothetical protein